jgi:tRNA A-37 threonylcarbamoyl transferase component Bud32
MTCATFLIALPMRLAILWQNLPFPIGQLFWIPYASSLAIGPVLLTFVTLFPRRLPGAGVIQASAWLAAGLAMAVPFYNAMRLVYAGQELRTLGPNSSPLLVVNALSLVAAVLWSFSSYQRVEDLNERRRLRVVVAGIAVAVIPGFFTLVYFWRLRETNQADSIFNSLPMVLVAVTLLAAPLSITYAVLRHRLFDLSFTIRKALRYTLARWVVLSLVPAISIFMILETIRLGHETVYTVLRRRGTLFLVLTLVAFVIFGNRRRWLRAIDRRFYRERHYAHALLPAIAEQVRRADSVEGVAPIVVALIEARMHPEFAALLVRDREARSYRTIAAAPSAAAPPDLRDDSKLVALAKIIEEPLDTSADTGLPLLRQVSASDREYIGNARIEALIRVVTPDDDLHALLALGPKRSEEPYAGEDYGVLVTIAENLSLLAGRPAAKGVRAPTLELCAECGGCFDAGTGVCPRDGLPLQSIDLPRTLSGRYRLDRWLADGGMGTVYEAFDVALERDVAAKVLGDKVVGKPALRKRFLEEARHTARLRNHPNVVSVHDAALLGDHQACLIMELLQGRTLRHLLEAEGRIDPSRALRILEDVGSAITAAHKLRLLHRDLKPENIFLVETDGNLVAKVLDFGIAKPLAVTTRTLDDGSETEEMFGTLEYMAPEHRRREPPSRSWDVWSLAVVALEMLCGRIPMPLLLPDAGPWRPGEALKDALPDCVPVFNRALAIDPADRPRDAETLIREIADGIGESLRRAS